MKKVGKFCLIMIVTVLYICSMFSSVNAQPADSQGTDLPKEDTIDVSIANGCHSLDGTVPVMGTQQLVPNMEAAFVYDIGADTVMYAFNADVQMHPASLVKIMTALLAVERGTLSDIVEVKKSVLSQVQAGAVSADLVDGEKISLKDLLYCMMVRGANDAAAVIADHISGSQDAFVSEMNLFAAELGCTSTTFKNAHGLHDPEQFTTARDAAKILNRALKNPEFEEIYSTVFYDVPATNMSESRHLASSNYLMNNLVDLQIYYDSRVTGGRTGVTDDGKRCLAAVAESKGRKLISIVMGSKSVYAEDGFTAISYGTFSETSQLFTMALDGYKAVQIIYDGQVFRQGMVLNGDSDVAMGAKTSLYSVVPENISVSDLSFRYQDVEKEITAPIEEGEKLSHVQIWNGNVCIAEADLYAMGAVQAVSSNGDLLPDDNSNSLWRTIIFLIAGVVVLSFVILLGIRFIHNLRLAAIRKRGRRYRKSRRRSR